MSLAIASGCGARSALEAGRSEGPGPGTEGGGGVGLGGRGGADGGGGSDTPVVPCVYATLGDPVVAVALPDRHAGSPAMVTTNGDPENGPLEVALQYIASGGSSPLHPDNPVVRLTLQPETPEVTQGATVVAGPESHSYGLMTRSTKGDRLLLAWFTDLAGSGRLASRTIDVADNELGPIFDIDLGASGAAGLDAGAGLGSDGSLSTGGYAVAWRRNPDPGGPRPTALAILDEDGALQAGPHDISPFLDSPPGASVIWTGATYLTALAYGDDCPSGEALCTPNAITLLRYRPPADGGPPVEVVAEIPAEAGAIPRRPRLVGHSGRTWLIWAEESDAPNQRLRLVEIATAGEPLGAPQAVGEAPLGTSVRAHASDQGIAIAWHAPSADDGPPDLPGAFELHVVALDLEGEVLGSIPPIPITTPQSVGPSIAHLGGASRSLALAWSGYRVGGGTDVVYLARLRCMDVR